MDTAIQSHFDHLHAEDKEKQYEAFHAIMKAMDQPVDWAYDVWDELVANLTHKSNHERSRAAQFLCGLAKSDPEKRMLADFNAVWKVTYDEKFVTARHTIQSIWKIGLAGEEQKALLLEHLVDRFKNGTSEKNYTLIRNDILQGLRNLYDEIKDEQIKEIALSLIEEVEDEKYKKKYEKIWKNA
ncbi:hypothetical protein [Ornithinibacillus californiensis]|uniref:hypothetical protein n=1 Tax=Ornithinibacillus californiensis TaxID=161536 RepID=UPI00064DFEFE|nr:hypothetical protein [Ornithinibacillus californiensis]